MARSAYIWVVQPSGAIQPTAAFTVKHELVTWLGRLSEDLRSRLSVWRLPDGSSGNSPVQYDVAKLIEGRQ